MKQRKHLRVAMECPVEFRVLAKPKEPEDYKASLGKAASTGKAKDLSLRGLLFTVVTPLTRHDVLQILFRPLGAPRPIEALAAVQWCRFMPSESQYSVGLRILNLRPDDEKVLDRMVATRKPLPEPPPPQPAPGSGKPGLQKEEQLVHEARVHWMVNKVAIGLGVVVLLVAAFLLPLEEPVSQVLTLGLAVLLLLASVEAWHMVKHAKLRVTNQRIVFRSGLLGRREVDAHLTHVEGIVVKQRGPGRALGYGSLIVTHRNGRKTHFKAVAKPHDVAHHFKQALKLNFD